MSDKNNKINYPGANIGKIEEALQSGGQLNPLVGLNKI